MWLKNFFKENGRLLLGSICALVVAISIAIPHLQTMILSNSQNKAVEVAAQLTVDDIRRNQQEEDGVTYDFSQVQSISPAEVAKAAFNKVNAWAIGIISVPDLDLMLPIYKGVSNEIMLYGAGTMKPNQQMGVGNYALASHNYGSDPTILFSPLLRSSIGMKVYLTDKEKVYIYQIAEVQKVKPSEVGVIDDRGKNELTLVTCDDMNARYRMIYHCDLVEIKTVDQMGDQMQQIFDHTVTNVDARS